MAKSGIKTNGTIKILISVGVVAVAVGGAWATKNFDVATNKANIKTNCIGIKENKNNIKDIDDDVHNFKEEVREEFGEQKAFRNFSEKAFERIEKKLDK